MAKHPLSEILLTVERIQDLFRDRIDGDGIDRKIASRSRFLKGHPGIAQRHKSAMTDSLFGFTARE
jgi:hypothetical protein